MNSEFMLSLVCLMVLLTCTKEVPVDISTEFYIPETEPNRETNRTASHDNTNEGVEWDNSNERWNHSRMLKISTTLGYDEWWFYTTRRPQIFFKDFPGRPGVATWKEISPNADAENRKSRKMTTPTASGVSSSSWKVFPRLQLVTFLFCYEIALFLFSFRWT